MNPLEAWEVAHFRRIFAELREANIDINPANLDTILKETSFAVRSKKHPDACPYYALGHPCHTTVPDLNCFLCACPNYIAHRIEGGCAINSQKGTWTFHPNLPAGKVWDCSACVMLHTPRAVKRYLEANLDDLKEKYAN